MPGMYREVLIYGDLKGCCSYLTEVCRGGSSSAVKENLHQQSGSSVTTFHCCRMATEAGAVSIARRFVATHTTSTL